MKSFRDHTGKTHAAPVAQAARERVADDWVQNARAIRSEDHYAPHVSEETKDDRLAESIAFAEEIRRGNMDGNFTAWQRINAKLTGECVAFLP